MSLKKVKKEIQMAGKGQNELYDVFNPVKRTRLANNAVKSHVPENGGTCQWRNATSSTSGIRLFGLIEVVFHSLFSDSVESD
jgi:hypothetical protein